MEQGSFVLLNVLFKNDRNLNRPAFSQKKNILCFKTMHFMAQNELQPWLDQGNQIMISLGMCLAVTLSSAFPDVYSIS